MLLRTALTAVVAGLAAALTPSAAQAQTFSFNRISCVVDLIDACIHVEAFFRPITTGTEFTVRLRVDQRTEDPTNRTSLSLFAVSFINDEQPDGLSVTNPTWLSAYGVVGRQAQPNALSWYSVGNARGILFANTASRGLSGCGIHPLSGLTTCADSGGLGALELNGITSVRYSDDFFTRILLLASATNAAGQSVGVGCLPSVLGLAQGSGAIVTPPQTESNRCFTREATESLAVGPYAILTTPEPRTAVLVAAGLLLGAAVARRRQAA